MDENGYPVPVFRMGTVHKKAYTDSSAAITAAISEKCQLVIVWCSTDAHFRVAATPVAVVTDRPITAKVDVLVRVKGGTDKIAAIRQSSSGDMYVTELL